MHTSAYVWTLLAARGIYFHSIPGRLRLEIPSLLQNPQLGGSIEAAMTDFAGVKAVKASPLTGRVLVEYDAAALSAVEVAQSLLSLHEQPDPDPSPSFFSANSLVESALEYALKFAVKLALGH